LLETGEAAVLFDARFELLVPFDSGDPMERKHRELHCVIPPFFRTAEGDIRHPAADFLRSDVDDDALCDTGTPANRHPL
jgi:hypothetical protein